MNFGLYAGLSDLSNQVILSEIILFRALDAWILWIGSGISTSAVGASFTAYSGPRTSGRPEGRIAGPRYQLHG